MKQITPQKIVDTTLHAIDELGDYESVNMREIARRLGCAHTNLYNYFPDFDTLLWKTLESILKRMREVTSLEHSCAPDSSDQKLEWFFSRFVAFYLDHPGWFRLIWYRKMQTKRPIEHFQLTLEVVDSLANYLIQATGPSLTLEKARYILHQVHCYLHGEISIFLAGKGLLMEEDKFRSYVVREAVIMAKLYTKQ